ncbi:hypothetical protein [Ralstonia solanacearum]|uniref:hypothetical protein n=1 Tax=Ralstonia solanacearum TaxID=305 RepID=UPI0012D7E095|nr:hypothetical protein [Ralstonia solanacearum]
MSGRLRIRLENDPDGSGELFVEFSSHGFSGRSKAWFDLAQLEKQVERFSDFPLSLDCLPCIRGGYWNEDATQIQQEQVYLSAHPQGLTGNVVLEVRLATPLGNEMNPDLHCSASAELKATYQQLAEFAKNLGSLIHGEIDEIEFFE